MAVLHVPETQDRLNTPDSIKEFLQSRGIWYDRWEACTPFSNEPSDPEVLAAYQAFLEPFMAKGGYTVADVINVNQNTKDIAAIRSKFLREHTHTEDEVRFFVEGSGLFWFHIENEVFSLLCEAGDLLSVPANTPHWFDLGDKPFVKAIRIFIDMAGWVPHYTNSGIDEKFNPSY